MIVTEEKKKKKKKGELQLNENWEELVKDLELSKGSKRKHCMACVFLHCFLLQDTAENYAQGSRLTYCLFLDQGHLKALSHHPIFIIKPPKPQQHRVAPTV
jgi:hypothetical protein